MDIQDKGIQHVMYICGNRKCGKQTSLRVNDAIKCDKCGYRILYKKRRTDQVQPVQYEAI